MLREIINVLRVVRPRHLLKALQHPLLELEAFKYHYRRIPPDEFVRFLVRLTPTEESRFEAAYRDLEENSAFIRKLDQELCMNPTGFGERMYEASAVYLLVRLLRPEIIVETGVADGRTSALILRALEENNKGKLYSIDVPYSGLPPGKSSGWLVPQELRHRWELRLGPSSVHLRPLLDHLQEIDFFIHDSLHSYGNIIFELRTSWPFVRPDGLILADDIGRNQAFFDFTKEVGIGWGDWRVYEDLGGFRVPSARPPRRTH